MKYFTDAWYASKKPCKTSQEYYDYMAKNYKYYPEWFKKYDVVKNGIFLFHDSLIDEMNYDGNDIVLKMVGITQSPKEKDCYPYNRSFELIFKNAQVVESPNIVGGQDVLAEELYCSSEGVELHMLLTDDDINCTMNLTLRCSELFINFESYPFIFCLKMRFFHFINSLQKRNRIKKRRKQELQNDKGHSKTGDG